MGAEIFKMRSDDGKNLNYFDFFGAFVTVANFQKVLMYKCI
jgi:hypothetical protein